MPRILLGEPQALVGEALARLLGPEFDVAGCSTDGPRLVAEAGRLRPDIVLTEVALPRLSGIAAATRLRHEQPGVRVVFLTAQADPRLAAEAFRAGARGYVLRSASRPELVSALRAVQRGERWLSGSIAGGRPERLDDLPCDRSPLGRLTPRRREVVELLAEGHSMKEAAAALGLTARTIAFHKYAAMRALDVSSSAQLVRVAVEARLLTASGG